MTKEEAQAFAQRLTRIWLSGNPEQTGKWYFDDGMFNFDDQVEADIRFRFMEARGFEAFLVLTRKHGQSDIGDIAFSPVDRGVGVRPREWGVQHPDDFKLFVASGWTFFDAAVGFVVMTSKPVLTRKPSGFRGLPARNSKHGI